MSPCHQLTAQSACGHYLINTAPWPQQQSGRAADICGCECNQFNANYAILFSFSFLSRTRERKKVAVGRRPAAAHRAAGRTADTSWPAGPRAGVWGLLDKTADCQPALFALASRRTRQQSKPPASPAAQLMTSASGGDGGRTDSITCLAATAALPPSPPPPPSAPTHHHSARSAKRESVACASFRSFCTFFRR